MKKKKKKGREEKRRKKKILHSVFFVNALNFFSLAAFSVFLTSFRWDCSCTILCHFMIISFSRCLSSGLFLGQRQENFWNNSVSRNAFSWEDKFILDQ